PLLGPSPPQGSSEGGMPTDERRALALARAAATRERLLAKQDAGPQAELVEVSGGGLDARDKERRRAQGRLPAHRADRGRQAAVPEAGLGRAGRLRREAPAVPGAAGGRRVGHHARPGPRRELREARGRRRVPHAPAECLEALPGDPKGKSPKFKADPDVSIKEIPLGFWPVEEPSDVRFSEIVDEGPLRGTECVCSTERDCGQVRKLESRVASSTSRRGWGAADAAAGRSSPELA
ncbi:unnamed protein product, partial [Prorocentrum cordatum]